METQTRFDLNSAIANWQQELSGEPDLTPLVRRELETHLRDTVAELQGRGLNSEESFWLARRRVGRPQQLSEEFSKTDPAKVWRERAFWMVLALLIIAVWNIGVNTVFMLLMRGAGPLKTIVSLVVAVRPIVSLLPILIGAILLAKGRFDFAGKKWAAPFISRRRLIAIGSAVMIFNAGVTTWYQMTQTYNNPLIWFNVGNHVLNVVIWPSLLTGLVIWLHPRRNSPESKPA